MINYNLEMENLIRNFDGSKKLLLHSCCGPCSTTVITRLKDFFDITVFYYNPCLYPNEEYEKRLNEQIKFINLLNKTEGYNIKIIVPEFNPSTFYNEVKKVENYETLPEGGARCYACYHERLKATATFAKQNGFDYFGTTLTVSPYKHSNWLNEIGLNLQNQLNINFLVSDFKKKEGYKQSLLLSQKYNLYRQNYCGCVYSYTSMQEYLKNNKKAPQ